MLTEDGLQWTPPLPYLLVNRVCAVRGKFVDRYHLAREGPLELTLAIFPASHVPKLDGHGRSAHEKRPELKYSSFHSVSSSSLAHNIFIVAQDPVSY